MLKKTTLAVIGLAASGFATAGSMGPVCTPGNVTVPCEARQWELGAQALYLESVYGATRAYERSFVDTTRLQEVLNNWNWGYKIEGAYHFNTGNDVRADWSHISDFSYGPDGLVGGAIGIVSPAGALGPVVSPFALSHRAKFDQVNLTMGQHVDVGLVKKMHFFGGLQYVNIQSFSGSVYPRGILPAGIRSEHLSDESDVKAIGPTGGINYSYDLFMSGLSITATGSGSVLYGTSRYLNKYVGDPIQVTLNSVYGTKKAIIPSLEGKLGLNYAYALGQGVLNVEGGYQVMNYFKALQGQQFQTITGPITNVDFGLQGPYVGAHYVGNV